MKVTVAEAKNNLTRLIKAVETGHKVTICRRGRPIVDLVRTSRADEENPKFGTKKGKIIFVDPEWWKPMSREDVEDFIEGRH
jgi:prevent-host-death family protein